MRELYRAVVQSDAARSVRLAGQLVLLTGLRLGEVRQLKIEHCHAERLIIPRQLMKTKDHWRPDFSVPLAPAAAGVIDQAVESAIDGFLFLGPRTRKPISRESVEKLFKQLSLSRHQPHGTRRSLRTYAVEVLRVPTPVANSLLDHANESGVAQHYDSAEYFEDRRSVLKSWEQLITKNPD